jgi:hypothetical protein
MSFLQSESMDVSPIQHHKAHICTDIFWASGELESLGGPHHYINQEGLSYLQLNETRLTPWQYTGLPASRPSEIMVRRESAYLLYFSEEESIDLYREPPNTLDVVFYFPLFIVQAQAPMLSEAKFSNFMDFWKGMFIPVSNASIHFLVSGPSNLPSRAPLLYVNRQHLQGYVRP